MVHCFLEKIDLGVTFAFDTEQFYKVWHYWSLILLNCMSIEFQSTNLKVKKLTQMQFTLHWKGNTIVWYVKINAIKTQNVKVNNKII